MTTIRERIDAASAKPIVTAAELALLVGVAEETIRRLGRAGKVPIVRVGRAVRYPRASCLVALGVKATVDA